MGIQRERPGASYLWEQPQKTWRNRQHTCLNGYKPELMGKIPASIWMGKLQGKSLAPRCSICTRITDLEEHFTTDFQGHKELERALGFLPSSYLFTPLPVLLSSPPENISLSVPFPYPFLTGHCITQGTAKESKP